MSIFKGAAVAMITPMTETQEVNYEKLGELIEEQIAGGTDAIVICGTTGEASTLSHEEHLDAIKYTVEKVNHRIPVIAGTGSNSTETAIYLSQEAEKYGVDGLLLVSPYYNKATQKGLIAHFTAIADSVKVPVILYNIQGRTGVNIAPETIAYLFNNVENIVAVKEASGNISQVAKIMQLTDGKIDLYSGNDDQVVPILSLGGSGVISVLSNVAPRKTHDWAEDSPMYNPDGKEVIARENEVSAKRKEDPSKAYFGCHTDITIPYRELQSVAVEKADGTTIPLIEDGRFVLPGTEELNEPFG